MYFSIIITNCFNKLISTQLTYTVFCTEFERHGTKEHIGRLAQTSIHVIKNCCLYCSFPSVYTHPDTNTAMPVT